MSAFAAAGEQWHVSRRWHDAAVTNDDRLFDRTIWGYPVDERFVAAKVSPGTLDARVLDQDRQWVDGQGRAHLLVDLDPGWRRNIAAFLDAKAEHISATCTRAQLR